MGLIIIPLFLIAVAHTLASPVENPNYITDTLAEILTVVEEIKKSIQPMKTCAYVAENSKNVSGSLSSIKTTLQELKPKAELAKNCADFGVQGDINSGVRTVYPYGYFTDRPVIVYCDQATDGGGWTVFHNREDLTPREKFERPWDDYVNGFGNVTGEFWLGLDNIHALVASTQMEMRVDLEDYDGQQKYAKFGVFYLGDASSKYTLNIGKYSGDAGDSLSYHNGMKFSTYDADNDITSLNCAKERRGAWWYNNCNHSNLNGYQYAGKITSRGDGIMWDDFRGFYNSLKSASMKVRPTSW